MTVKMSGNRDFQCKNLPGISFRYPVFIGWEPKSTQEIENGCIIYLNWPSTIKYETERLIYVTKIPQNDYSHILFPPEEGETFILGKVKCFSTAKNQHGIFYGKAFNPQNYTPGYNPPNEHWDYLQFYSKVYGVRIQIDGGSEKHGFSSDAFVKTVIETFRIKE